MRLRPQQSTDWTLAVEAAPTVASLDRDAQIVAVSRPLEKRGPSPGSLPVMPFAARQLTELRQATDILNHQFSVPLTRKTPTQK